jgi:CRISPR-associated endonuclease/helicase Cas3
MSLVPYPFQRRVAELLLGGRNVILQAPTGAGKTMAAMLPFLDGIEHGRDFPHKCLYAVPMRVLANQFVKEYGDKVRCAGRDDRIRVAIQTGERADDEKLAATLTFATIDQVLSSFLLSPYSLPRRLSNLNAGAVAASYLVFDEFHLFDPISTLPTTLEMLRMLRGIAPFLLMTATFSSDMLDGLAGALDAVVVPEDEAARQAMQALPSQQKTRRYHLADGPLSAEAILARHWHHQHRTLVVCNVVDRARTLFEALRDHPDRGDTQVLLLHSRFLPEDRQRIEGQIHELFSQDGDQSGSWIVVATQVIEVGLDVTCHTLHTELAPANAILQRAGRCARYEGEEGDVFIYTETPDTEGETVDLTERVMPYRGQKEEVARTLAEFQAHDGEALTFSDEEEIVSAAHGPRDRAIVEGLVATREMHRRRMNSVMDGQRSGEAGDLIRAVSSRLVVVHDDPGAVAERPFRAEAFSLHPGTLYGLVEKWLAREWNLDLEGFGVRALHDRGDVNEQGRSVYCWLPVQSKDDVVGSALVLVHPALAGYDPELGFVSDRGTGYRAKLAPVQELKSRGSYTYRLERYAEHVRLVYQALLRQVWPELAQAATRLERAYGWPTGTVERAAHLVVLFHDVGKLNRGWQKWVVRYQKSIGRPAQDGFYAHTDSDPTDPLHVEQQKTMGRRPPHAVEGAMAAAPLLAAALQACEPVFNAAFTAIARHHGAFTRQGQRYTLAPGAHQAVAETLAWLPSGLACGLDTECMWMSEDPTEASVKDFLIDSGRDGEFLAYVLLARALRRADQAGTQAGHGCCAE